MHASLRFEVWMNYETNVRALKAINRNSYLAAGFLGLGQESSTIQLEKRSVSDCEHLKGRCWAITGLVGLVDTQTHDSLAGAARMIQSGWIGWRIST